MNERFPNLLVIGAMKCGTTSLHEYLRLHPDIFMSEPKEIHYYAEPNFSNWSKEYYLDFFKSDKKIIGTSPQSYTKCHNKYYQDIPSKIYKDSPNVKMIYIVRDPIERYKSHILESYHCDDQEDINYSKASGNYWKTSMYYMQMQAYLEYFKMEQLFILSLEELKASPLKKMNEIFEFLGLDSMNDQSLFKSVKNAAESKKLPRVIKNNFFYRLSRKVSPTIAEKLAQKVSHKFFEFQMKKPQLSKAEELDLREKLREDIKNFKKLTGKEFPEWVI